MELRLQSQHLIFIHRMLFNVHLIHQLPNTGMTLGLRSSAILMRIVGKSKARDRAAVSSESAPGHSPTSVDCNSTLMALVLTRWLRPHPAAHSSAAAALQHTLCMRTHVDYVVGSLSTLFCLCLMLMQYITLDRLTLGLQSMAASHSTWKGTLDCCRQIVTDRHRGSIELCEKSEIARIVARNVTRIDLPTWIWCYDRSPTWHVQTTLSGSP